MSGCPGRTQNNSFLVLRLDGLRLPLRFGRRLLSVSINERYPKLQRRHVQTAVGRERVLVEAEVDMNS